MIVTNLPIFRAGDYGDKGKYSADDLTAIARDYEPSYHEAPVTTDHRQEGPAYGWVKHLRAVGETLHADVDVADEFAAEVRRGAFKKRSVELYRQFEKTGRPYLRALTFLGACPPHVKGMADPQFKDAGEHVACDFAEPCVDFAYMPDPDKPDTWRLRFRDADGKASVKMIESCARAISPGGLDGKQVVPPEDQAAVRARLREAYAEAGVAYDAMSEWVKEFATAAFSDVVTFAAEQKGKPGEYGVQIMRPGFTNDKARFYKPETVKRDGPRAFKGARMHTNHQTDTEARERPEGDVLTWVGNVVETWADDAGNLFGTCKVFDRKFRDKLEEMRAVGLLGEMRLSALGKGRFSRTRIEGVEADVCERIIKGRQVDFVTEDNAGGRVLFADAEDDIDLMTEDQIKRRRPELFGLQAGKEAEEMAQIEELQEALKASEAKNAEMAATIEAEKTEREKAVREAAQAKIAEAVKGAAELPAPVKARLIERFKDAANDDGVAEAIDAERALGAAWREANKPKGVGGSEAPTEPEDQKADVARLRWVEMFTAQGYSKETAEHMADRAMAGRQ